MSRFAAVALVLVMGCSSSQSGMGTLNTKCRPPGKLNSCDQGLVCESKVCVRPPPADCTAVGETIALMDRGNYSQPEERAPVAARYKAACEKEYVSKEQGECLNKATDKWSARQCAPKVFADFSPAERVCAEVVGRIESVLLQGTTPPDQRRMGTMKRVMQQSCEHDEWPDALKNCILSAQVSQDTDAMQACNSQTPPELQTKMQARLQAAN